MRSSETNFIKTYVDQESQGYTGTNNNTLSTNGTNFFSKFNFPVEPLGNNGHKLLSFVYSELIPWIDTIAIAPNLSKIPQLIEYFEALQEDIQLKGKECIEDSESLLSIESKSDFEKKIHKDYEDLVIEVSKSAFYRVALKNKQAPLDANDKAVVMRIILGLIADIHRHNPNMTDKKILQQLRQFLAIRTIQTDDIANIISKHVPGIAEFRPFNKAMPAHINNIINAKPITLKGYEGQLGSKAQPFINYVKLTTFPSIPSMATPPQNLVVVEDLLQQFKTLSEDIDNLGLDAKTIDPQQKQQIKKAYHLFVIAKIKQQLDDDLSHAQNKTNEDENANSVNILTLRLFCKYYYEQQTSRLLLTTEVVLNKVLNELAQENKGAEYDVSQVIPGIETHDIQPEEPSQKTKSPFRKTVIATVSSIWRPSYQQDDGSNPDNKEKSSTLQGGTSLASFNTILKHSASTDGAHEKTPLVQNNSTSSTSSTPAAPQPKQRSFPALKFLGEKAKKSKNCLSGCFPKFGM